MSLRTVLYSGGHGHAFADSSAALADRLAAHGCDVRIETDFDAVVAALSETDLVAVNALRWTMTQHEKYAPFRPSLAYRPSPGAVAALADWVRGGGRLFALHTAVICFDVEPGWLELLGGGWTWGLSHHPPLAELTIEPADAPAFVLVDEAYHNMNPAPDAEIRARCAVDEGPQPTAWIRPFCAGRVAVDTLGHDRRSLETPGHAQLIDGLLTSLLAA